MNKGNKAHNCRSSKLTQEQSKELVVSILSEVKAHIGKSALLIYNEGRKTVSFFVKIFSVNKKGLILVKHRCFSPSGEVRCLVSHCITVADLLSGCQKVIYLDDI